MGITASWLVFTLSVAVAGPDAAQLLSRFPAGAVPDTAPVHQAISELAARDDGESLSLLQSLGRHESGAVRDHATEAEALVANRLLHELRVGAAAHAPSERDLRAWVGTEATQQPEVPASELRVVGYAALVTHGTHWDQESIGSLTPDESTVTVARAEALELEGRTSEALPLLVDAAMSGDARATHALIARGVDVDRLALGLSSEFAAPSGLPRLHLAPVLETTDPTAVKVLLSRAESGGSLPRLAAIENLGVLLRMGHLDDALQKRARATLDRARTDLRPVVRTTAESALALSP
jgi:hypothetical protein